MTAKRKKTAWKPKKPFLKLRARPKRLEVRPYRLSDDGAWAEGHSGRFCLRIGFGGLNFHRIEASCDTGKKHFSLDGGVDMLVFAQNQIDYRKRKRAK